MHPTILTAKSEDVKIEIDVTAYVKWEERARAEKKNIGELLSIFLQKTGTTNL